MIRQKDIWEYLQGNQTGREANQFEQEMLSDPFLYEAMEGLASVGTDHEKVVQLLQAQLEKRARRRTISLYRWIAAASFLLLVGIAVTLMYGDLSQQPISVAEFQKRETRPKTNTLQLVAGQYDRKDSSELTIMPVRTMTETVERRKDRPILQLENEQIAFGERTEEMEEEEKKDESIMTVAVDTGRMDLEHYVVKPAQPRRKIQMVGGIESQPEKEREVQEKKKRSTADNIGRTKSIVSDSLKLARTERRERRMRGTQMRNMAAIEKKYLKEEQGEHAEWVDKFNRYVTDSLRYPEDARLEKVEGEVQLAVRLNRKGLPARIKFIRRLSSSCNREAIRLVEEYPGKWENTDKEILLTIPFRLSPIE